MCRRLSPASGRSPRRDAFSLRRLPRLFPEGPRWPCTGTCGRWSIRCTARPRLPARVPDGWQKRIELSLRLQWGVHRRHSWLACAYPLTRPHRGANGLAHTEWIMRAMSGLRLDPNTMLHATVSLAAFVRGLAANLEPEARAVQNTGMSDDEWMAMREAALNKLMPAHPTLAAVLRDQHLDLDLDTLFEFGLRRQLDALEALARTD
ncbi:TetR/AcrR family transcriptional regulator C-terminal domain-containing protein [Nonomuraea sp. NPDC050547]|uniref:TetR/AcrR family transcriptional regulator C-terminal domain-containing protein n=1 Tax=Nonomuraea sp. NPDC050547 TaxID=3364368 RepID=UPI0037A62CB1